jgi:hypothetical protein
MGRGDNRKTALKRKRKSQKAKKARAKKKKVAKNG